MTDPPQCKRCNKAASALDLRCKDCRSALRHKSTTPGQLFAALRQWEPSVQQEIDFIVEQILAKGVDPNARDELTDLSLLHFAAKSAAPGLGDELKAVAVVNRLIKAVRDADACGRAPTDLDSFNVWCQIDSSSSLYIRHDMPDIYRVLIQMWSPSGPLWLPFILQRSLAVPPSLLSCCRLEHRLICLAEILRVPHRYT